MVKKTRERIVVAMSGGVDSSVAAALLKSEGYEVIGITMCFSLTDASRKKPACCSQQGIEDAERVAHKLGIKHYVLNMQKALKEFVIDDFCAEYLKGRTPNPCVRCNQFLKFGILLKKALALGAPYLATGHYARIVRNQGSGVGSPKYLLKKAKDKYKDQSYFLYRLGQDQLKHIIFPLGSLTKSEVRNLARKLGLAVAEKTASQEICFLPDDNYRYFLERNIRQKIKAGLVLDTQGNVLGEHRGIPFYTVGQREGLGIAAGYPLYITEIEAKDNRIIVGKKEEAFKKEFLVKEPHFIASVPNGFGQRRPNHGLVAKKKVALRVRIRYNHKEAPAEAALFRNRIRVKFRRPQFAITPGQSAVFYDRETILGGGIIEEVLR